MGTQAPRLEVDRREALGWSVPWQGKSPGCSKAKQGARRCRDYSHSCLSLSHSHVCPFPCGPSPLCPLSADLTHSCHSLVTDPGLVPAGPRSLEDPRVNPCSGPNYTSHILPTNVRSTHTCTHTHKHHTRTHIHINIHTHSYKHHIHSYTR